MSDSLELDVIIAAQASRLERERENGRSLPDRRQMPWLVPRQLRNLRHGGSNCWANGRRREPCFDCERTRNDMRAEWSPMASNGGAGADGVLGCPPPVNSRVAVVVVVTRGEPRSARLTDSCLCAVGWRSVGARRLCAQERVRRRSEGPTSDPPAGPPGAVLPS